MSYFLTGRHCNKCGADWMNSFGIVGTAQIGDWHDKCIVCGSDQVCTKNLLPGQFEEHVAELTRRIQAEHQQRMDDYETQQTTGRYESFMERAKAVGFTEEQAEFLWEIERR